MKKTLLWLFGLAVLAAGLYQLPEHLWVRNKTARMVYDGHVSDHIKLYAGTRGRLLVVMAPEASSVDTGSYLLRIGSDEVRRCAAGQFFELKSTALARSGHPQCESVAGARFGGLSPQDKGNQSLRFVTGSGKSVEVTFDPAPRER